MNGDHIQEKLSNQDILIYPFISMYILVYIYMSDIHVHICQSYPMYVLLYPLYPSSISRENIPNDIQLWILYYIQIYPFVSNIDICIRYPWCYPIWLCWNILFILVLYPGKISMMISNYDILVISKYIHV